MPVRVPVKYRGRTTTKTTARKPITPTYSPPTPPAYSGSYYRGRAGRAKPTPVPTAEQVRGPSYTRPYAPAPGYMAQPENVRYYGPYYRYYDTGQNRSLIEMLNQRNKPIAAGYPTHEPLRRYVPFAQGRPHVMPETGGPYTTPYGTFRGATGEEAQAAYQARGIGGPVSMMRASSPGYREAQKAGWTQQDWINYVMNTELNPPKPVTGVFFNPAIPRANVFLRDAEGHIVTDDYGNPIYQSTDFTDYLEKEGVKIYWPDYQAGPVSGAYTEWLLTRLGYGYGDRGVNPYARPQPEYTPPPSGGGGGYPGGGGGGGRGGGGGGGKKTEQEYAAPFYYQNQRAGGGSVPRWIMDMVQWRI